MHRQILRDFTNRSRYGADAPLSAMTIYPRPRDITHRYARKRGGPKLGRQHSGLVKPGDWDLQREDLSDSKKLISCRMRWEEGAEWQDTPVFRHMLAEIAGGHAPDGCRTPEDLLARYRTLDRIFAETRACGRLLEMHELPDRYLRRAHGATLVHLARDGTCLRSVGGAHRFAIAHILDLPEMPAQLGVVHPQAVRAQHLKTLRISSLAIGSPVSTS